MADGDRAGWWAADPTGRHELRYWDGAEWTMHVADGGEQSSDPVPAPAVPPALLKPSLPPPVAGTGVDPRTGADRRAGPSAWRALDGLRTALVVLLGCSAAASVAMVLAVVNRLGVIDDLQAGRFGFDLFQRANDADDAVDTAGSVTLMLALATAVVFIAWQWRCAKNAELLGRDRPRFTSGWSIGGWFIPFANLVIPLLVIQDLWRASSPTARSGDWHTEKGSVLVVVWWVVFLVSAIVPRFVDGDEADTLADLEDQNRLLIGAFALAVVAAALAIAVVVQLTRRFDDRRDEAQ